MDAGSDRYKKSCLKLLDIGKTKDPKSIKLSINQAKGKDAQSGTPLFYEAWIVVNQQPSGRRGAKRERRPPSAANLTEEKKS